jgi:predicted N-formylglutamate amidohydrolase
MDNSDSFEVIDGDFGAGLILLCDHACNYIPPHYDNLGIAEDQLSRHIAYDIGGRNITLGLAQRLGVPAVMSKFSRLLIDPNRGEDDPTLIMYLSDGAVIKGNYPLSEEERQRRIEAYYRPYHQAISEVLDKAMATGNPPMVFSIHSFTDKWKGVPRPWEAAILWDNDPRMAQAMIVALSEDGTLTVGDNAPYDGALINDTMYKHCTKAGLAHSLIEVRQDLISNQSGVDAWVDRLTPILEQLNKQVEMHEVKYFGSRRDKL